MGFWCWRQRLRQQTARGKSKKEDDGFHSAKTQHFILSVLAFRNAQPVVLPFAPAMISRASNVEAYIAEVPADRRAAVEKLRSLCRKTLKAYEECMEYGMPCYKKNGVLEVSFANQKQYVALYVLKKDVVDE